MKKLIQEQAGGSRGKQRNFAIVAKFRYIENFLYISEISLCSENFTYSEILYSLFLCTNDPVLVNFISTLTVIILFRLDWYFHLFVRLYKPFFEHFVT